MSLFRKDLDGNISSAINYFNSLSSERKAFVVSNLLELSEDEINQLHPLLTSMRNDISNYNKDTISNKLFGLGIERTYAVLFVENMIQQAPTLEYELKEIDKMDNSDFKEKFPRLMQKIWIEKIPPQELIDSEKITRNQLWAIVHISKDFMNGLIRSITSPDKINKECKNVEMSDIKITVMLNIFNDSLESWRKRIVFSNTQDTYFTTMEIHQQNNVILNSLKEILNVLKNRTNTDNTNHYQ